MNRLTTEEKLNLVLQQTEKHNITAYEIGENTELNASGIHRILTGEVKKPRDKTLSIILEYIESRIVGTQLPEPSEEKKKKELIAREENPRYGKTIQEMVALEVIEALKPHLDHFNKNNNDIIRSLLETHSDIDDLKDEFEEMSKKINEIHKVIITKSST